MAAKLSRLIVSLLAAASLWIAAPAHAAEPPCVGYTGLVVVCVFPFECHVLGNRCQVAPPNCIGDPNVVAVCRTPFSCYVLGELVCLEE